MIDPRRKELLALRRVAGAVERMTSGLNRRDLSYKALRVRGSVTTIQPTTRDVIKLLDALAEARKRRVAAAVAKPKKRG